LVQGGWSEAGSAVVVAPAGAIGLGCDWQAAHPKTTAKIEIKRMVLSAPIYGIGAVPMTGSREGPVA
jgi:hypothetical protein